ncbi:type II 3-dehydroquinate dehydratase [Phaeobacter inhibens]|uniref:type II 3-dehydroquinate dehydratase n=1 Tax=Phaeobacter inhibens TaxID=221822 RepID=UPI00295EB024|nr:type II 3-dehydroquinate dehydratase [Phaeobacter inhibens]
MHNILVLNGPNLNLLGTRQPEVYGRETLAMVEQRCVEHGHSIGLSVRCEQSNHEGALLDALHGTRGVYAGVILNAGAYTHTSIALMDAIFSIELPVVEVHLSNIHAREDFRHRSYLSRAALGQICGFGAQGYIMALDALRTHLDRDTVE